MENTQFLSKEDQLKLSYEELMLYQSTIAPPHPRRWWILVGFMLFSCTNAAGCNTFSVVANYAEDYYNINVTALNWFGMCVCIVFMVTLPPNFMALNKSIHWTLLGSLVISAVGLWIRYVAFSNYWIALFGQAVMGLPNVICLAMPPVLASAWFAPNEHFLCVMLAETANFLGAGFAYLLSSLTIRSSDDVPFGMLVYALFATAALIFYFLVGKTEPIKVAVNLDLKEGLTQMVRDCRLMCILIFGSMGVAVGWTILGVMQEQLQPFDVDNISIGVMGLIFVLAGFLAGLGCSYWVRQVHKLQAPLNVMLLVAIIGLLGLCLVGNLEIIYVFGLFIAVEGVGIIGFVSPLVEAAIERLDHENLVTTTLFTLAQCWQLIQTPIVSATGDWFGVSGFWALLGFTIISSIGLVCAYRKPERASREF